MTAEKRNQTTKKGSGLDGGKLGMHPTGLIQFYVLTKMYNFMYVHCTCMYILHFQSRNYFEAGSQ